MPHSNRYPGTDEETGWLVAPVQPCYKANEGVLCYLGLGPGPMYCVYQPGICPFYGHYPWGEKADGV